LRKINAALVNWFELIITGEKTGKVICQNGFITNHAVSADNVAPLAEIGRTRWKIENENNNTLKTKGITLNTTSDTVRAAWRMCWQR
jgi:hypothetical protein